MTSVEPSPIDPSSIEIRQATLIDVPIIHALLRPYVMQRLLLGRTEAELVELSRHGFVAIDKSRDSPVQTVGFCAVEIYSPKLAELQALVVHHDYRGQGVGRELVQACVDRAKGLGVMEVMAISSNEEFLRGCGFDYSLPDQKRALFCQLRPRPKEDQ
ncbi:MAG: GNAT family N-acetyltransferase [Planctomycetota bacterium]